MTNQPGGWRVDVEDWDFLNSRQDESPVLAMRGSYKEVTLDPRVVMHIENQGSVGSCQGHSISSCCEWVYMIATGDTKIALSRAYGYYESQRIDNIRGDSGSTIQAGIKLATTVGIPREELWTYSGKYNQARPANWDEILKDAENYKIGSTYKMTTYDGMRTFLGSGQGAIHLGITWNGSVDKPVVSSYSGAGGGGHSIGLYALSDRKDNSGRPWLFMQNSWGSQWGQSGWAEWSPDAITQMLQSRNSIFVGVSDMPNVKPRTYELEQMQRDLRV